MPHQDELFPPTTGFKPDLERKEPRLWVRELRIYRHFAPGDHNLLRRIALRPGLNILWAKPRERSKANERSVTGVSGHATGKTTFCRFLRYLLGESTFGNDEQRERLRDKFPESWIVGEVHLDGTPWLVCRPLRVGPSHAAYRDRTIETLFEGDAGYVTYDDFRNELTRVLAEPLPVTTFATSPTPIEWPHVMQWLTRDQECRFAGLAELRHTSSDSASPNMSSEDTHFLFRAVLGLIDPAEQSELETNKELLRKRHLAERDAPLLRFRGDSAHKRLRDQFPDFRTDLAGADFLSAVEQEWRARSTATTTELQAITEPAPLVASRDRLVEAQTALRRVEEQKRETEASLAWIDQQIQQLQTDPNEAKFDEWLRANTPSELHCRHTIAEAIEWECPLAVGQKLPIEKPAEAAAIPVAPTLAQLGVKKTRETARQQKLQAEVERRRLIASAAAADLKQQTGQYDGMRAALQRQQSSDHAVSVDAKRAHDDLVAADSLDVSIKELDQNIRRSQERQGVIREQRNAALSAFSDTFARVARAIFNDDVTGSIRFNGRKIRPTLVHDIDLTSAALETLKIICFDLSALISGIEGRARHPLFLLHDGPREADMDADLYQQIFRLIRSLEDAFGKHPFNFQYIVTTTEPPPDELQKTPWLLAPQLDATTEAGKLLRESF